MKYKRLDEVCDFISGLWTGKKAPYINVGVIRNTNFHGSGNLDFTDIAQLDVEAKQFSTRQLKYGDIILEKSGGGPKQPVGRVCVFEKREGLFSLSNFTSAIRVKDEDELDYKYLYYFLRLLYLKGETEKIQTHSTGIRNLQLSLYKEFLIPMIDISLQRELIKKLDFIFFELDKASQSTASILLNIESLFKIYLTKLFTEDKTQTKDIKLKEICQFVRGLTYSKSDEVDFSRNAVLRATNIELSTSKLILEEIRYINDTVVVREDKKVKLNDILICTASGSKSHLGKVALINSDMNMAFGGFMAVLRVKEGINPEFFFNFLRSPLFVNHIQQLGDGANINNLKFSQIEDIIISVPSFEIQNQFSENINLLENELVKMKHSYLKKLKVFDVLKESILKKSYEY